MTAPDPDATGPDGLRPDPAGRRPDLPEDVDAAFASIVADWAADGAPRWPDEESGPVAPEARSDDGPPAGTGTVTPPQGQRAPSSDAPVSRPRAHPAEGHRRHVPPTPPEDEHYVPPEPPPLPRLGLSSLLGLALLVVGVVLLAVPGLLGGPVGLGIVPGLLAMTAGLGWLVFGLRRHREPEDGPDDGAIL
ncbi:hypothetical protein EV188_105109 [Actinomycetospora succinea]|uniref:DUF308 domain-containing protein n=1 Tax=Actinomycetospora succinea TaxID=663603 RepID=A0A4R6V618_9PSEU|nr:DUF308 domain-containing protein [Actinomycetospora succinea]TDQ55713.1 hypothetical protein EV188_105109 [Actinomycetospora succinea]